MIYLLALPLTALASALHGWGRFRKGYSFPLLAVLFCALLFADGVTYWYAGIMVAAGWRFLFRTGKIAKEENGAIQYGDKRSVFHIYWIPFVVTMVAAFVCDLMYWNPPFQQAFCACIAMLLGGIIHQLLHDYVFNWRVFNPAKWYDIDGRKFFDVRRFSEISGGLLISGAWCAFALLAVAKIVN